MDRLVRGRFQRGLPLTWRDNPYPLIPGAVSDGLVGQEFQDFQDWNWTGLDWTKLDWTRLDWTSFCMMSSMRRRVEIHVKRSRRKARDLQKTLYFTIRNACRRFRD